jgi:hypothetical protein
VGIYVGRAHWHCVFNQRCVGKLIASRSRRPPWVGAGLDQEEDAGGCAHATSTAASSASVANVDAASGSAPAPQHSVWTTAALDAAAVSGAAAGLKHPAFCSFETESPGVQVGAGAGANVMDWRQEWNSL